MPKVIHQKSLYIIYSILSITTLNLILVNSVHADNLDYSVTVQPSLSVTTSASDISLNLNPATNPFDSENLTVSVGTNNQTGYKLYVSTPSNTTNLVEQNDSNLYIETLASAVSESNFTPNRWGYKLNSSSTNYTPFESGILVNSSDGPVNNVSATMTFAAKASYGTKAGTYNLALNFQATANPLTPTIQDLDPSLCITSGPTLVIDSRDEQEYYVQRLADGNCWMIQNLKLGKNTTSVALTNDTSDVPSGGFTLNNKLIDGKFPSTTISGTSNVYDGQAYYCTDNYGCYYNWYTATAGTGVRDTATDGESVDYSICPVGWTLPTKSEWVALYTTYDSTSANLLVNPTSLTENTNGENAPGLLLGGYYLSGGGYNVGNFGSYWSRTAKSAQAGYGMGVNIPPTVSLPADSNSKHRGQAVRCLRRTYMQDVTSTMVANMNNGDKLTLTDARDNKSYTAAKINGQLWMTQNLRYIGDTGSTSSSMIMKSATSNINADKNLTIGDLTSGNSYDEARIHVATSGQVPSGASYTATDMGVWYNYAAASAGYVTSNQHSTDESAESVCPKNWRLPTNSEMSGITSYQSAFFNGGSAVTGGGYYGGSVGSTGYGIWWSSTPYSSTSINRYNLYYNGSSLNIGYDYRYYGFYVRCIHN